ncbi:U3 small nucleolar RNA-associated protein 18 [Thelohanellus kitauei]|uniref:U3 small nucleolar RNA-associated protein 18 n=1 Tax=Thelohanellus kitauei TaxID=669202 RepID=A0A0C2MU20_THEKT|nr:U3 small nucleolar RNA-associated protein 18 [Thelohanellus kitauei]
MDTNWGDEIYEKSKVTHSSIQGEDGAGSEAEEALREAYLKSNKTPGWASPNYWRVLNHKASDEIIHKTVVKPRKVKKAVKPIYVANYDCLLQKPSSLLTFHPSNNLLFASGRHNHFQLIKVEASQCEMVKTSKFLNFHVFCAKFIKNGEELMFSCDRKPIYFYNIEAERGYFLNRIPGRNEESWKKFSVSASHDKIALVGDQGQIPIISERARHVIGCMRQGSALVDVEFSKRDENILYSLGCENDVYLWDIRNYLCVQKNYIPEMFNPTVISLSCQDLLAIGSKTGQISLFNFVDNMESSTIKTFDNLTLPINFTKFNPEGNLLCFGTHQQKKGIRMVDIDDLSVLTSWPFIRNDLGINRIYGIDFSYDSQYLALGNCDGRILINRVQTA